VVPLHLLVHRCAAWMHATFQPPTGTACTPFWNHLHLLSLSKFHKNKVEAITMFMSLPRLLALCASHAHYEHTQALLIGAPYMTDRKLYVCMWAFLHISCTRMDIDSSGFSLAYTY
jgi:hypothetical protein